MEGIVIIGGGIAGLTAAEAARRNNREIEISIITNEDYYPYSRIKLSKYLDTDVNLEDLYIHKKNWYEEMNINMITSSEALKVDSQNKEVLLNTGEKIGYSKLILANGSYNFIPPFKNVNTNGVFSIRNIKDILDIQGYINKNGIKRAAVIGGGLLGLEAAWSLKTSGDFIVSVIQDSQRILPRQLDEEGSAVFENEMNKNGIKIYKGIPVKEIGGGDAVKSVIFENGMTIDAEIVIISAGVRSNSAIAREAGIAVNRGILVNRRMETNLKDIYAAGDCAEYNEKVYGIWPVAVEQGRIAALNALGIDAEYNEVVPSNMLQVLGINVFSTGDISRNNPAICYDNGLYTKLFIRDGLICGAILIGDTKKGYSIKRAIEEKRNFSSEIVQNKNLLTVIRA